MADMEKPVTFGATIHRPNNEHYLTTLPLGEASSNDSALSSAAITPQSEHDTTNPFSAFYKHPDARRSMEESAQQPATSKVHLSVYEHDLEAGTPLSAATTTTATHPKVSVDGRVKECTMWPSRQTVLEKKKATKRARGCAFFKNLTAKQRLWAKIIIALVIVAAAVGLGVGISRAVGGGVWAGDHERLVVVLTGTHPHDAYATRLPSVHRGHVFCFIMDIPIFFCIDGRVPLYSTCCCPLPYRISRVISVVPWGLTYTQCFIPSTQRTHIPSR